MEEQFVIFDLEDQSYAVDISHVNEITQISEITKVPKTESYYEGILNLRGKVVPIVSLKTQLGISASSMGTQILIIEKDEQKIGFLIDYARDVKTVDSSKIEAIEKQGELMNYASVSRVIKDQGERIILILNLYPIIEFMDKVLVQ